ncbi:MAG: ATP-binding protein [Deltaproteobacteria bacterium]|nr:ATP-binding protein [Deltaproteobacteria bacterium]
MLEVLARWNRWDGGDWKTGFPRRAAENILNLMDAPEILCLVGPRRAGKTTVLHQLAAARQAGGRSATSILHVDFEEPLLAVDMGVKLLEDAYVSFREKVFPKGRALLLLDEIQHVPGWERWVRARNESEDVKIVVTGSSSALLGREFGTRLTGRHLSLPIWPLDFAEALRFRGLAIPAHPARTARPAAVVQALADHLRWGGFPEVVLAEDEQRKSALLKQYFDDLLFKDVALRHRIRDLVSLRALAVHLMSQSARLVSFQRLSRVFGVSLDMVRHYCQYLDEAFLIRLLPYYSLKAGERQRRPQKVHALDTGLRNAVALSGSPDLGHVAETAVFSELLKRGDADLHYWKGRGEVDLLLRRGTRVHQLIQVAVEGLEREEVRRRELMALEEARKRFRKAESLLLCDRAPEGLEIEGARLEELWRFFLD